MNRARAVLTALSLLAALGLAGCSDDDPEPKFEPTPTSAPSSAATTEAAALETPEDVVRAWIDARNAAMQDGDLTAVRALSSSSCESCDGILDPIEDVFTNGGHFETEGWTVVHAKAKSTGVSEAKVSTALEFAGGRTVQEAGAEPVVYDSEKHIVVFELGMSDDRWQVDVVGFLS